MTNKELEAALISMNMSQADLAKQLDVRPETVWRWVNGKVRIKGPTAKAIRSMMRDYGLDTGR